MSVVRYHIDPVNGNNSNDGLSPGTAWKDRTKVNALPFGFFSGGRELAFLRGTTSTGGYFGFVNMGGMTSNPLAFKVCAYGDPSLPKPIIQSSSPEGVLLFANCGRIEVCDVEVDGTGSSLGVEAGINVLGASGFNQAYGVYIHDVVAHNMSGDGISLGSNLTANMVNGLTDYVVERCEVYACKNDGISWLDGMSDVGWIIRFNNVNNIGLGTGAGSASAAAGDGITGHSNTWGHKIYGNIIDTCRDGMHFVSYGTNGREFEVFGNVISNCSQSCIRFENANAGAATSTEIRELTIANNICTMAQVSTAQACIAVGPKIVASPQNMFPFRAKVVNNTTWSVPSSTNEWNNFDFLSSEDALSTIILVGNASHSADASKAHHVKISYGTSGAPTVIEDGNAYVDDDSLAFSVDGSTSNFAGYSLKGANTKLVSTLGFVGDPIADYANAKPVGDSPIIGVGIGQVVPTQKDFFGQTVRHSGRVAAGAAQFALEGTSNVYAVNKEVSLTANTLSDVTFSVPVKLLRVQYSGLSADAKMRVASGENSAPTNNWDAEEPGSVVTFGATADYLTLPIEVEVDPPSYTVRLMPSASMTVHLTAKRG